MLAAMRSARCTGEVARRVRIQYEHALYHVINRGNYRRDIFSARGAARAFSRLVGEACERHGWHLHATPAEDLMLYLLPRAAERAGEPLD